MAARIASIGGMILLFAGAAAAEAGTVSAEPLAPQLAQRPPIAETALQKALRGGGKRLSADEIRSLLLGATIDHRRPADGALGSTYIGQDGRWRARNRLANGQSIGSSGTLIVAGDAVCFVVMTARPALGGCPSADARSRAVVRQGQEIVFYFLDDGSPALVASQTRRGNPENL